MFFTTARKVACGKLMAGTSSSFLRIRGLPPSIRESCPIVLRGEITASMKRFTMATSTLPEGAGGGAAAWPPAWAIIDSALACSG
jgi:hypothetical protein